MKKWFGERSGTLKVALGPHWLRVLLILAGLFGSAIAFLQNQLENFGLHLGLKTSWLIIAVAFLAIAFWFSFEYANRLRVGGEPKIKIGFDLKGGLRQVLLSNASLAVYVRPYVEVESTSSIKSCRAYLNVVERVTAPEVREDCDGVPLTFSHNEASPAIEIPVGIRQHIDVLRSLQMTNTVNWCGYTPLNVAQFFGLPGDYIIDILVLADGNSATARLKVIWNGQWDQIKAELL